MVVAEASLTLHMKMAHSNGNAIHQCRFCRKLFTTSHRKETHEKRHVEYSAVDSAMEASPSEELKSFTCPFCDKSFKKVEQNFSQWKDSNSKLIDWLLICWLGGWNRTSICSSTSAPTRPRNGSAKCVTSCSPPKSTCANTLVFTQVVLNSKKFQFQFLHID